MNAVRPSPARLSAALTVAIGVGAAAGAAHLGAATLGLRSGANRAGPLPVPIPHAAARTSAACPHPPVGDGPADFVRILDSGNNRVQTFDAQQHTFAAPFGAAGSDDGQLSAAGGVAVVPSEVTYVADSGNDRVQRFDRGGAYIDQFGGPGTGNGQFDNPTGIGVDSGGNMFVLDSGNNRVQKFDMNANYVTQWGAAGTAAGQFSGAVGLAVGWSDGAVYVADTGNNRLQKFDSAGAFVTQWGGVGAAAGQFSAPAAVAVHPLSGDVYVADTGNHRVQQFGGGSAFIRQWGTSGGGNGQFTAPRGIAVGARNGVVVMDSGNDRLQKFGYDGAFVGAYGAAGTDKGQFNGATAIAANLGGVDLDQCHVQEFTLPDGGQRRLIVYYTTANGLPANRLDDVNDPVLGHNVYAKKLADWSETAWTTLVNYGLGEPSEVRSGVDIGGVAGREHELWVFDIGRFGLDGWCCGAQFQTINARMAVDSLNGDPDARYLGEVAIHELFHSTQPGPFRGSPGEPGWSTEGGAANMQDKIHTLQDAWAGSSYVGRVNDYLASRSQTDLREVAYPGALFWTYLEEQVGGATPPDPGYGVSAMDAYFGALDPLHGFDAVDAVVRARSTRRIEDFWTDFTVANYTKRLAGAGARFAYVDEAATPYGDVPVTRQPVTGGAAITVTRAISAYAASYERFEPDSAVCNYVAFDMRSDERIGFSVADHRAGSLVRPPERFWGRRRIVALRVGGAYGPDDGMTTVLTGIAQPADVTVSAGCVNPTLEIIRPQTANPGLAGPFDNPGTLLVYVSVKAGAYGPVRGLIGSQFAVRVGGRPATLSAAVGLEDLYALVVAAPAQPADGDYDLEVTLDAALTATQAAAVRYTSRIHDTMLVIDRSGSMLADGKLQVAKDAAQLEITEMDRNAFAGLVSFATTASPDRSLVDITVDPARTALRGAVDGLAATGWTAIVAGLNLGLDRLAAPGTADHSCGVTLLSDGMENQSTPAERTALLERLRAPTRPCPVYAIALGPDADKDFLQQFADASGGVLYPATLATPPPVFDAAAAGDARGVSATRGTSITSAATGSETAAGRAVAPVAMTTLGATSAVRASWQGRLVSIFDDIAARQAGRSRVFVGARPDFVGVAVETVPIDPSVAEAVFAVYGTPGLAKATGLWDPDGVRVTASYPDAVIHEQLSHWVIRIKRPRPGEWQVRFQGQSGYGYVAMTSADTPIALDVLVRPPHHATRAGHRVPILAVLHDRERALPGATVVADVQATDGAVTHVRLLDDGAHGDGAAGDGVYGNVFTRATTAPCRVDPERGVERVCDSAYQVHVVATLGDVRREGQAGFAVQPAIDRDQDGLPDEWEREHGIDPKDPNAAKSDADNDGLAAHDEFARGTDPFDADTDGGGENDGSEVRRQRDPLAPEDDRMRRWWDIVVRPIDGAVRIGLSAAKDVAFYRIDRQVGNGTWRRLTDQAPATGVYTDKDIKLGETYVYRVLPIGPDGAEGVPLTSVAVKSKADNEPPRGWLHINDLAPSTADRRVTLSFGWETDAVLMRLGNRPDLGNAKWQPLARTLPWNLDPNLGDGQTALVYVEYRDAAGNISDTSIFGSIVFDPAAVPSATATGTAPPAEDTPTATATGTAPATKDTPTATGQATRPIESATPDGMTATPDAATATATPQTSSTAAPTAKPGDASPTGGVRHVVYAPYCGKQGGAAGDVATLRQVGGE